MGKLRIVPVELDDGMVDAGQEEIAERESLGAGIFASDIWEAMQPAIPALTAADVDELTALMWPIPQLEIGARERMVVFLRTAFNAKIEEPK